MQQAAGTRVLCVGDLMLDRYVYGNVERISPEGPVPVFLHRESSDRLGGAGNVCMNLAALGVAPHLNAVVGDDPEGRLLHAMLGTGLGCDLVTRDDAPTTLKTRYIARGQQVMRIDKEDARALSAQTAQDLIAAARARMKDCDMLILSDYAKGALSGDTARQLIDMARAAGMRTIADPKSEDFGKYRGAFMVTPNLSELHKAAGPTGPDLEAITKAARRLCAAHDIEYIAVTLSENGILIVSQTDEIYQKARKSDVFDVTGAGDAVVAALSACLLGGMTLQDAAEIAMVSAGIAVTRTGAVSVPIADIDLALRSWSHRVESKIVPDRTALAERVRAWRAAGETVGFANGVFDLLHPGHLSLLGQASAACTRLIVALNSDSSVRRLKGPSRPIQSEDIRARIIASIEGVAAVTVFDEDTPLELITAIQPDLLVKGSDYTIDKVVGADVVQARGGAVLLVDLVSGLSTTSTVARIKDADQGGSGAS